MTSWIGKLVDFDPAVETWQQYVERLEHFFEANEIREEARKTVVTQNIIASRLQVTS